MSDESKPSPLRLKPRLKSDSESAAAPDQVVTPPSPPAVEANEAEAAAPLRLRPKTPTGEAAPAATPPAEESTPRIRLKPKLNAETAEAPAPAPASEHVPAVISEAVVPPPPVPAIAAPPPPPPLLQPASEEAAAEGLKFKLKAKSEGSAVKAAPAAAAPPPPAASAGEPAPASPPAPAADVVAPPLKAKAKPKPQVRAKPGAPSKRILILAGLFGSLLLGGGGYYAFTTLTVPVPPPVLAPPPPPAAAAPASLPGQLIGKAQDAIAGRAELTGNGLPEGLEFRQPPVVNEPAPEVIAEPVAPPPPPPPPEASTAFRTFAINMRVNGVFQGDPPRALLNGRTVRVGDMLDSSLGVVFEGVDVERRLILLRDQSGASATKKY